MMSVDPSSKYGKERVSTRNNLGRNISWLFIKYVATKFFVHCVCTGPSTFVMLRCAREPVEKNLGDDQVKFGEYENHWH
jgi:hypothetical protein